MTAATKHQRRPHGIGRRITALVHADLDACSERGRAKYGEWLRAFNGRDALADAYQESIDECQYLRQMIEERRVRRWLHVVGLALLVVWRLRR
jgi:hypothetical protein